MKKQLTKILSIVLSIAVVLSVCGVLGVFNATASDTEKVTDYYVGYGGTGDGSSLDKMAPNVATAIKTINANGLTAADTANIWIVQTITAVANMEVIGTTAKHNMAYWSDTGTVDAHAAKLVIKPHADNTGLADTYLCTGDLAGNQDELTLGGPTEIDGVRVVFPHSNVKFYSINANGHDFVGGASLTYGYINKSGANANGWTGTITNVNAGSFSFGDPATYNDAFKISFKAKVQVADPRINIPGYDSGTYLFNNDITLDFLAGGNQAYIATGTKAENSSITFEKNINIKLQSGSLRFRNFTPSKVILKGGLQFIKASNSSLGTDAYPLTNMTDLLFKADGTTPASVWTVNVDTNNLDKIDFIEGETGKFKVAAGYKATATDANGGTVDSNSGVLDLSAAAGEYTVTFLEQADKVYEYYVKAGGTGSGTSVDAPAASVAAAITKINALGLDATETATIYIMQDITAPALVAANAIGNYGTHNMAFWGEDAPEHAAKIIVKPYSGNSADTTWLATTQKLGLSSPVTLGGPTEIDGITLVLPYGSNIAKQTMFEINGKDLTLGSGFKSGYIACNSASEQNWDGTINDPNALINSLGKTGVVYDKAIKVTYDNNIGGPTQGRIDIPAYGAGTFTFKEDVTYEFGGSSYLNSIRFGNAADTTTTFEKNLNFKFDFNDEGNNMYRFYKGSSNITVNGGVQVIDGGIAYNTANGGEFSAWDEIPSFKDKDGNTAATWYIKVANDDVDYVNFIAGVTGKFTAVKEGYKAVAFKDGKLVKTADENGVMDLSAETGTYEIQFLKEVEYDFDKDFDFDKDDCAIVQAKLLSDSTDAIYDVNGDNLVNICDLVALNEKLA